MKLLHMRGSLEESKREAMVSVCARAGSGECERRRKKRNLYPLPPATAFRCSEKTIQYVSLHCASLTRNEKSSEQ